MAPLTSYLFPRAATGAFTNPRGAEYLIDEHKERLDWVGALWARQGTRATKCTSWDLAARQ
ncbi:hypothetical protein [Streptomyces sp. NPDC056227]|uniref:hypothetical protein n=1 Tax=Streptomyces sp. NPDC056227 TaxID=3345753 RepID=UPI0035DB8CB8